MYEATVKFARDPMKILFDKIDFSFIYPLVEPLYKKGGRPSFDPVSLFKALLFIYMDIKIDSERMLSKALRYDMRLLATCGFEDFEHTPSHATFSLFRTLIGDATFYEILHRLIAHAFALGIIDGAVTATDSTHLWAFSNKFGKKLCTCADKSHCSCPKTYSDPDATWGKKNKDYSFFGYKAHLVVDTKSQLPISVSVTTGSCADNTQAIPLMEQRAQKHSDIVVKFNTADSAYDTHDIYRYHQANNIVPIIDLNTRHGVNALLTNEITFKDGRLCCKKAPLYYFGYDRQKNKYKFRCPVAMGKISVCDCSAVCNKSSYGRTVYLAPTDDIRLFPNIPRFSQQWSTLYNQRTAAERTNSEIKGQHRLLNNRFRTLPKVKIHVYLSCIALILKRFIHSAELSMIPAQLTSCA